MTTPTSTFRQNDTLKIYKMSAKLEQHIQNSSFPFNTPSGDFEGEQITNHQTILNFCITDYLWAWQDVYMVWEDMLEDHSIQEYLELFYQAIDASFNYVLLKVIMKDA